MPLRFLPLLLLAWSLTACERGDPAESARGLPIRLGQSVEGRLEESDFTDVFADGSFTDLYVVELGAGQGIVVELSSSELDTYLSVLRGPGDQLVDNDDISPEDRNSRLTYRAQAPGRYYIAATTFRPGQTGAYTLRVSEAEPSEAAGDGGPPTKTGDVVSPR